MYTRAAHSHHARGGVRNTLSFVRGAYQLLCCLDRLSHRRVRVLALHVDVARRAECEYALLTAPGLCGVRGPVGALLN